MTEENLGEDGRPMLRFDSMDNIPKKRDKGSSTQGTSLFSLSPGIAKKESHIQGDLNDVSILRKA